MPSAPRALAQLAPRAGADSRAAPAPGGARRGSARAPRAARARFLCGRLADSAEHDRRSPEAMALAQSASRRRARRGARRRGRAARRRSCARRAPEQLDQVVARGARVGDHAVRAPARASGTSTPHAQRAQADVRLGEGGRSGRGSSTTRRKRPRAGAGAGEAVHEVDARARAPPAAAAAARRAPTATRLRACTGTVTRGTVAPRPGRTRRRASRLTNAVKRERPGARRHERRDQLARVDLHAAGLAGHEEDEVEADMWALLGHLERHRRHGAGQWRSSPGRC